MIKKLAIVTPGLLPVPAVNGGAVETLISYLIEGNEENHHYDITVYTCDDEKLDLISYKHTKIIQIKNKGMRRFIARMCHALTQYFHLGKERLAYDLYLKHVRWEQYDDILVENSMRLYELLSGISSCQGKLSYHMHNDIEDEKGDKSPRRTRLVLDTARHFLVVSDFIKRRVIDTYEGSSDRYEIDKIEVLYNCIDVDSFRADEEKRRELRNKLGIANDDFIVLYTGRIAKEKGVLELAKAIQPICMEHKDVKLLIVGCCWFPNVMSGEYMDELRLATDTFDAQTIFTGFVAYDEVGGYYDVADVVVVPTLCEEAFGMVAIESRAKSKPLIVTDSGGLLETIDEGCAMIVMRDNKLIDNLRNSLLFYYRDQEKMRRMGAAGRRSLELRDAIKMQNYYKYFISIME